MDAPKPKDAVDPVFSATALMADVEHLSGEALRGRGTGQPGGALAAEFVASTFRDAGLVVTRQAIRPGAENVIGIAPGGPRAILISAHYDHLGVGADGVVYPGADDNASGTTVLLALARYMGARRHRHTMIFVAFGAEEIGLLGSAHYVADPIWPLAETEWVINFDMVGRHFWESGAARPATVAVVGLEGRTGMRQQAMDAARHVGLRLLPVPARVLPLVGVEFRTDDWWFRHHRVPAIHFSTGLHPDYHRVTDTPDKLIPAQMSRIARLSARLINAIERGLMNE